MTAMEWRHRILIDPRIHHGDPCIKGTRVPVSVIVGSIADGETVAGLLAAYPQITEEDIRAALKFAAKLSAGRISCHLMLRLAGSVIVVTHRGIRICKPSS